ncbi:phospholipase D-like domain-containing protein [Corallococcus sp. bb12-1]|uniref:phospholipase D-like domain-containing protein n=1 Tax=Corallococcus sp. bb12-1 TaxID=2996784 RepID=UPI00226F4018|nr:phospholipase D-like domain-containing protein [Corallococcus sp. bb12-1]MCY1044765.1 phospholipase D-like domain-containing protein [Corallococcus sp. bb12-1]
MAILKSTGISGPQRGLAEQVFSRAAGAPLVPGNDVHLLRDARENYPAWLSAIQLARRSVLFENYIIEDDDVGRAFADALEARARDGVRVCVLYDWLGCQGTAPSRFWRRLREAGVEVRCFNPFQFDRPLAWLGRNHRKTLTVDGEVGFVSGLCVSHKWVGDPEKHVAPWRDTGLAIRGPAVADLVRAFAQGWATVGAPLDEDACLSARAPEPRGDVALRVVAGVPWSAGLFRVDQLIASLARKRLWLTDAYFVGTAAYVQALRAASRDGVDVRLLVPGSSDIPVLRPLTQAGYRPLLEAGIRVYEWNGTMLHAKTAVADGLWARVGSSNLNPASWLGNSEIDVAVEDIHFAQQMEAMYQQDLEHATEVVLSGRDRRLMSMNPHPRPLPRSQRGAPGRRGSMSRAAAGAVRLGNTVGAAVTNHRELGRTESKLVFGAGVVPLALAGVALWWPQVVAVPAALLCAWAGIALWSRAARLRRQESETPETRAPLPESEVPPMPVKVEPLRVAEAEPRNVPEAERHQP